MLNSNQMLGKLSESMLAWTKVVQLVDLWVDLKVDQMVEMLVVKMVGCLAVQLVE